MNQNLILKKCLKCGSLIEVINDCNCKDCGIMCCNSPMQTLIENDVDASFEKHIPTYKREGDKLIITVNHGMEEDHYIEWISVKTDKETYAKKFTPQDTPIFTCTIKENATIYSYCNKHGLWKKK